MPLSMECTLPKVLILLSKTYTEIPLVCVMHPMYFEMHYVFGQDTIFLQQIKTIEMCP